MKNARCMLPCVLFLLGCHSTELTGRSGADADDASNPDALDSPYDAPMDTFSDLPPDWTDTSPDTPLDSPPDPPPDGPVGTCNIIEQTGCPVGWWCAWDFDEESCTYFESCHPGPPGELPAGSECSFYSDELCVPGTDCYFVEFDDPLILACLEWCRTDDDCSLPGTSCWLTAGYNPVLGPCAGRYLTVPYMLCWEH